MSVLEKAHFTDESAAFRYVEAIVWPNGPVCPHCGGIDRITKLEGVKDKKGVARLGLYKCNQCRGQFTVRKGTIFEASHIALRVWLQAIHLVVASKKGISANQLHRLLGITLKSAWFLGHRIREAMQDDGAPLGGPGKVVEADETFHGPAGYVFVTGKGWQKKQGSYAKPHKIVSLVERGGRARSFKVEELNIATFNAILTHVYPASTLNTD